MEHLEIEFKMLLKENIFKIKKGMKATEQVQ